MSQRTEPSDRGSSRSVPLLVRSAVFFYIGTSGYAYKEWKGRFYPKDLPAKAMLRFYSDRFKAVEINNTFYRLPTRAAAKAWLGQVPEDFCFILKAPQQITHFKRLKAAAAPTRAFLKLATVLGPQLGPLLFQLPPNMKKDAQRLRAFLKLLAPQTRAAFEFRHQSWFDDEVLDLLRAHKAALCIAQADDDLRCPVVATTDWGYLRLRRANYTSSALNKWARHIRAQPWREVFVFFKHEDTGTGPKFAARLIQLTT